MLDRVFDYLRLPAGRQDFRLQILDWSVAALQVVGVCFNLRVTSVAPGLRGKKPGVITQSNASHEVTMMQSFTKGKFYSMLDNFTYCIHFVLDMNGSWCFY